MDFSVKKIFAKLIYWVDNNRPRKLQAGWILSFNQSLKGSDDVRPVDVGGKYKLKKKEFKRNMKQTIAKTWLQIEVCDIIIRLLMACLVRMFEYGAGLQAIQENGNIYIVCSNVILICSICYLKY